MLITVSCQEMASDSNTYKNDLYEMKDFRMDSENGKGEECLMPKCIDTGEANSTLRDKIVGKCEDKTEDDKEKSGGHMDDALNAHITKDDIMIHVASEDPDYQQNTNSNIIDCNDKAEVDIDPNTSVALIEDHAEGNAAVEIDQIAVGESVQENLNLGIVQKIVAKLCCYINPAILTILIICVLNISDVASDFGLVYYLHENEGRAKIILIHDNDRRVNVSIFFLCFMNTPYPVHLRTHNTAERFHLMLECLSLAA